jgi:hypothetical protein
VKYILTNIWKIELFQCNFKQVENIKGIDTPCVSCRGCYEWNYFLTKIKKKDLTKTRKKQGMYS